MTPNYHRSTGSRSRDQQIWHLITPEYPPRLGGVSDYSRQVAIGLRDSGDEVHVWCAGRSDSGCLPGDSGYVHWLSEGMTLASIRELERELNRFPAPLRLLVQWVPHGYGWRSMNILFCLWLWKRAKRGDRVEIMLHEAFLQFREGNLRQDLAAAVHRIMTVILLRAASHVWMSTPSWEPMWRRYCLGREVPFVWLPIPANVPVVADTARGEQIRFSFATPGQTLIGHFSTHGKLVTRLLDPVIPLLLRGNRNRVCLLIGQSSNRYRDELLSANPDLEGRILASGAIDSASISKHLMACDLLLQPYPEGITARRTSAMAGLAHGVPVVTSSGPMTEPFWHSSGALALVPFERPNEAAQVIEKYLEHSPLTKRMGLRAKAFYEERFAARHMVQALRGCIPG